MTDHYKFVTKCSPTGCRAGLPDPPLGEYVGQDHLCDRAGRERTSRASAPASSTTPLQYATGCEPVPHQVPRHRNLHRRQALTQNGPHWC
jgi:hypothetical protein